MNREFVLAPPHGSLRGELAIPPAPRGLAVIAKIPGNPEGGVMADDLVAGGYGVLSIPLLTEEEAHFPDSAYNVPLLTQRFADLMTLLRMDGDTEALSVALYAGGHAVPAAIRIAALRDGQVRVLACHGGLIDLAGLQSLRLLEAPLLMLSDADDAASEAAFQRAAQYLSVPYEFVSLHPGESPGSHIARWFGDHLQEL